MASPEELPPDDVLESLLNDGGEVDDANVADALGVAEEDDEFKTLKYSLLGQSLLKAGQDSVDQSKVRRDRKRNRKVQKLMSHTSLIGIRDYL